MAQHGHTPQRVADMHAVTAPPPDLKASDSRFALPVPAAAPHRLLFLGGAVAVLLSIGWWALELGAARLGIDLPQPSVPPGWAHAMLTQYGMLPLFMLGFLLTVFPRWLNRPALRAYHYLPVFALQFGGYVTAHVGLLGRPHLLLAGFVAMLAALLLALLWLGRVLVAAGGRHQHALSCYAALAMGALGQGAFLAFLLGASWWWAMLAIQLGTFGFLLPMYLSVCHRMIPFFSANVVPGYRMVRPRWSLPVLWTLLLGHLVLSLLHAQAWLWAVDAPLTAVLAWHAWAWQPWRALRPGLLAALHLAFAWLPLAFLLFTLQSVVLMVSGDFVMGRAPLHALAIGFFGSMLVAMVTRVTQGHSGRPLRMGAVAWFGFGTLQLVALSRILAGLGPHHMTWLLVAAVGWLVAFTPWVLRSAWIYLTPRVDGKEG
jgi:uncharacterized protein involved in response to NO